MQFFGLLIQLEIILQLVLHRAFPLTLKIDVHKKTNSLHIFFVLLHTMYQKLEKISREPDSPVTTTSLSLGISRLIFFRLCTFAPFIVILSLFIFCPLKNRRFLYSSLFTNTGTVVSRQRGIPTNGAPTINYSLFTIHWAQSCAPTIFIIFFCANNYNNIFYEFDPESFCLNLKQSVSLNFVKPTERRGRRSLHKRLGERNKKYYYNCLHQYYIIKNLFSIQNK